MENANKQLIIDFYAKVFGKGDEDFAKNVIDENYIQHNPMVKSGKQGFMEFFQVLKQMPKPQKPKKPFMRFVAEGDLIAVHSKIPFMGKVNAVVDLYRVKNGLITEHWDVVQPIVNDTPKVTGTTEIDAHEKSDINKVTVGEFIDHVLVKKQFYKADSFLTKPLSLSGFETNYQSFKLCRTISDHNFVVSQAEVVINGEPFVRYDIFRLSGGFIVEHWAVSQKIPEDIAHSNGMI